jgi:hypothetical protein
MKINENEKRSILDDILAMWGLIAIVFFSFMIIRRGYHLTMYPRYTIGYVDKHVRNRRYVMYFFMQME